MPVQHEQRDIHFLGRDCLTGFVAGGERCALLVDGFADCLAMSDLWVVVCEGVVYCFDLAQHEFHVWGGMEQGAVRVAREVAKHGEEAVGVCYKLVFLDKPAGFVGECFFVLDAKGTCYFC